MRYMLALALLATPAISSTPQAWAAHDSAARTACAKAAEKDAGLVASATSAPILFSDGTGAKTAVLVDGRYKQPFMKKAKGTMLCLYDRGTKRADVSEAKGWAVLK